MRHVTQIVLAVAIGMLAVTASAQRGTGADTGVAQRIPSPSIVTKSGKITKVETGPCEGTTGRSLSGVHLLIQEPNGDTLNLHLGPTEALNTVVDRLAPGQSLSFEAFRTDRLPSNHFIAKTLMLDDEVIRLRDDNLRPSWAYGGRGRGPVDGRGPGGGWGPCR